MKIEEFEALTPFQKAVILLLEKILKVVDVGE
jgi:hypothetical protein